MAVSKVFFAIKMQESSPGPSRFPGLIENPGEAVYTFSLGDRSGNRKRSVVQVLPDYPL